eukprot:s636_g46.t1
MDTSRSYGTVIQHDACADYDATPSHDAHTSSWSPDDIYDHHYQSCAAQARGAGLQELLYESQTETVRTPYGHATRGAKDVSSRRSQEHQGHAVKTLNNARKDYDEAVLARTQSHTNWKQFLGDAVQLWKSYAEQFAVQEKTLQDHVNVTREAWKAAKDALDQAKHEAGEIFEIQETDEEQEAAPNEPTTTLGSASKISDSMQGLATSLATLHQEAEEWVEQDRQSAKRPRKEKAPEPGDAPMGPGEHFGTAG